MRFRLTSGRICGGVLLMTAQAVGAQVASKAPDNVQFIDDDLTGVASRYDWVPLNGACLTAGNGSGSIPACNGLSYYRNKVLVGGVNGRLPDPPGLGALRLTNGAYGFEGNGPGGSNGDDQNGAVVSKFTFPSQEGIDITFSTVTYGGDGNHGAGADGLSFFLADGSQPPSVGAMGGSLGYSCSNIHEEADGVVGGYLGIGMDEFGNFSSRTDATSTGEYERVPNRIVVRGAGSINWATLYKQHPQYYGSVTPERRNSAVRDTCALGKLLDFSRKSYGIPTNTVPPNYKLLAAKALSDPIATQQGLEYPRRGDANPVTYALRLTQDGRLSLHYSYNGGVAVPVLNDVDVIGLNGRPPQTFRFGFAASTGQGSNVHEITCFKVAPASRAENSAAASEVQSSRVDGGPQFYFSSFDERFWTGRLIAHGVVNRANGEPMLEQMPRWDAACGLTGGICANTGKQVVAQAPFSRTMLTWNGASGVPLRWWALTAAQQGALSRATDGGVALAYLRGWRRDELGATKSGTLRKRKGVLGDIVRSSPVAVGAPAAAYEGPWRDLLHPERTAPEPVGSYAAFRERHAQRLHAVYVGANDGLLHAFRAGGVPSGSGKAATLNDGHEILAYMPSPVVDVVRATNPAYDLTSPQYVHNLYVDATPGTGDLFYGGGWHTWLVGGLGGGARSGGPVADDTTAAPGMIYALDITDPAGFVEAKADKVVLGEWSSARLDATGVCNVAQCGARLGMVYGTPQIRRLHNGRWAVLFGNGYNSAHGSAGLFVMLVDPARGAAGVTFRYIDTGHGPARDPMHANRRNGIGHVTAADLDGDHITDHVYAGDLFGNVWRFDLTDEDPEKWKASAAPLYASGGLPISTKVVVSGTPGQGNRQRVMVHFGTGRRMERTIDAEGAFVRGEHGLHGVWDADFEAWNKRAGQGRQLESSPSPRTATRADLLEQTARTLVAQGRQGPALRTVSRQSVCWSETDGCGAVQRGWRLSLPGKDEQVIHDPTMIGDMLVVNTTIPPAPAAARVLSCAAPENQSFTMAVRLDSGGAGARSFFDVPGIAPVSSEPVSGIGLDAMGTPTAFALKDRTFIVQQTAKGVGQMTEVKPVQGGKGSRVNWMMLR